MSGHLRTSALLGCLLLAACAGPPPAPVEDRSSGNYQQTPDGAYRIRRGDTLYAIAFRYALDWRDLARWNDIGPPYTILPEQLLRLSPPVGAGQPIAVADSNGVEVRGLSGSSGATTRAMETGPAAATTVPAAPPTAIEPGARESGASQPGATESTAAGSTTAQAAATPSESAPATVEPSPSQGTRAPAGSTYKVPAGDPKRWLWPTDGNVRSNFAPNDSSRKGIDIGGKVGQDVIASADGQVVYSGSGLIGYGELIIIKHSDRMLSAYAHNSKRLVGEGVVVQAGQKISEMGTNDRNQPILHFEIRVNGVPQNPVKYLPQR